MNVLAIDQGTSATKALVLGPGGAVLGEGLALVHPQAGPGGAVTQDPGELLESVRAAGAMALAAAGAQVSAVGLGNQGETVLAWNRGTGVALGPAVSWQDRRAGEIVAELAPHSERLEQITGLELDPYFAAPKMAWLARRSDPSAVVTTVDSWITHQLTGAFVTDAATASRTMLLDLATGRWSDEACALFGLDPGRQPAVAANADIIGETTAFGERLPVSGLVVDQQAALFAQSCLDPGEAKCTYGTGAFALMNIGDKPILSEHGLVTTVAWGLGGKTTFALEGSAFIAGAAVQWLRDGLGIIKSAQDIEALAKQVESSDGVVFVPALAGLGAPHWDQDARGTITGLTRATTAAHLARATLEGIAFEVTDLLGAMVKDAKRPLSRLRVDGGAAANDLLMQFQSDVATVIVERPADVESTGRGAAMLAGLGAGLGGGLDGVAKMARIATRFEPKMTSADRDAHRERWDDALARTRSKRDDAR